MDGRLGGDVVETIRIVQAGLGGFGRGWATIVRDAPNADLAAVVDPLSEARDWAASALGLDSGRIFASLDAALAAVDCDALLVATPPETHHAVATAALERGCHVLVEKPLATTIDDALDLIATAERSRRHLMVSQNYRFRAPARAARQAIASGALGQLVSVRATFRRDTRRLWPPGNFRYAMRHPVVLDMAIHHADLLRLLTGRNVARLDARSWRVPDSPYRHDPEVAALMELEGGIPVVYEGSWAARGVETSWNADWEVVGEGGRLGWTGGRDDALTGDVVLQEWGRPPRPLALPGLAATDRAGALRAFLKAIAGDSPPETSAADNIHSLAIVLACVRSIERRESVDINELFRAPTNVPAAAS
jgi:predicted dehydrogenase